VKSFFNPYPTLGLALSGLNLFGFSSFGRPLKHLSQEEDLKMLM